MCFRASNQQAMATTKAVVTINLLLTGSESRVFVPYLADTADTAPFLRHSQPLFKRKSTSEPTDHEEALNDNTVYYYDIILYYNIINHYE